MRTNFMSPIRMNLAVLPLMLERGSGTIVNVASGGGRFGIVHESAYCAAKFAMTGWSEVAAMDLADTPIEVKLIQPGAIATEIWVPQPGELPGLPGAEFATARGVRGGHRRRARDRRRRVLRPRRSQGPRGLEEQRPAGVDRPHGGPRAAPRSRRAPEAGAPDGRGSDTGGRRRDEAPTRDEGGEDGDDVARRLPASHRSGRLIERRRDRHVVLDLTGHPHDEHAPTPCPRGSTSSTSKATTVLAEAVCRLVPPPVRKTIWPSSSR